MPACRSTSGRFKRCGATTRGGARSGARAAGRRATLALPLAKTIATGFGISEAQGRTVRAAMAAALERPGTGLVGREWGVAVLKAANKALDLFGGPNNRYGFRGAYGVEYIPRNQSKYGAFHHVNTGDPYSPTIAFYPATGRIRVVPGGWARAAGLD